MVNEDILQQVIQLAPDAIILVSLDGIIKFVNNQTTTTFGYTSEELVGQKIEILVPEQARERHVQHRATYNAQPRIRAMGEDLTLQGRKKDGELFPVEISLSPIKSESYSYITAIVRDVTKRNNQRNKLMEANKDLEHFVYVASHNLQEPLKSIKQLICMLKEVALEHIPTESQAIVDRIANSSDKMSELIKDLLNLARIGNSPELKSVNCQKLIEDLKITLRANIEEQNAQINIEGSLPTLPVYASEFQSLLQNLIQNSIKFHKKEINPIVVIKAEARSEDWLFSVKDNGIGVDEKFIPKLFLMFQRYHNQNDYPGTGIGLAHCKKIVNLHGGEIWIETKLGEGSTFFFTIPFNVKEPR